MVARDSIELSTRRFSEEAPFVDRVADSADARRDETGVRERRTLLLTELETHGGSSLLGRS
jgi:hypothetical protein